MKRISLTENVILNACCTLIQKPVLSLKTGSAFSEDSIGQYDEIESTH